MTSWSWLDASLESEPGMTTQPHSGHGHGRDHDHDHGHDHTAGASSWRLAAALGLASSYLLAEVVGGIWTGSLALLADAGHMTGDVAALGLALVATWLSTKPATARRTFGYHRAEVLAALVNGTALVVIGVFILIAAVGRWNSPPEVLAGPMFGIAAGGLLVNIAALFILHGGSKENLNVKGAFLHVMADALGSLGAMTSGALIWAFDWRWADPLASMIIAVLVIFTAVMLIRQTVEVLMQSAPARLDMEKVQAAMVACDGVTDVHDVHAWTLSSGRELLSAHLVIDVDETWNAVIENVRAQVQEQFSIAHVTLQPEPNRDAACPCAFVKAPS